MLAPITVFVYKRVKHLRQVIDSLKLNPLSKDSYLIIHSDGPRTSQDRAEVFEVRRCLKTIRGFKKIDIIEHPWNLGVEQNNFQGITQTLAQYGKGIFLDDDVVVTPFFLSFMNKALDFYEAEERVGAICAYPIPHDKKLPDTFFSRGFSACCWGGWNRSWEHFQYEPSKMIDWFHNSGRDYILIDKQRKDLRFTWDVIWSASLVYSKQLILYPYQSLVLNIGHDGTGEHCPVGNIYNAPIAEREPVVSTIPIVINEDYVEANKEFAVRYRAQLKQGFLKKLVNSCRKRYRELSRMFKNLWFKVSS